MPPQDERGHEHLPVAERVNIALANEAAQALARAQQRSGLKKVDIVNRAIQLYEFLEAELRDGRVIILRDNKGNDQLVKILF